MTSTTIKLIPIKQLALSPLNVRKTQAGPAADAELKASIKADGGIKQNLLVYPAGKNKFLVHGGGRRLKQLKALKALRTLRALCLSVSLITLITLN